MDAWGRKYHTEVERREEVSQSVEIKLHPGINVKISNRCDWLC